MNALVKVGIFYDGNYFAHVSNYYNYIHPQKSRINISGLHEFIRKTISCYEHVDICHTHIVDAHYFRGRYLALDSQKSNKLMPERQFDDILMTSGIVTHYLPITQHGEKGIDVWFSMEAFELSINKKFDVVVLLACDNDYIPLVRKLNTLGIRIMVLSWEFEYIDPIGKHTITYVPQQLINEISYPLSMRAIIDEMIKNNDPFIDTLFVKKTSTSKTNESEYENNNNISISNEEKNVTLESDEDFEGTIQAIKDGYGFIKPNNNTPNVFFFYGELYNVDFNDLKIGDLVKYKLGKNDRGLYALQVRITN